MEMQNIMTIATCVIAAATIFYVFGTFRLWKITRDAFMLNFILYSYGKGIIEEMAMRETLQEFFPKQYKKLLKIERNKNNQP